MRTTRWYRSGWAVLAAGLVLPPAGLVLLWMRPAGLVRKILGSLVMAGLGAAHLFLFYGLRAEFDGTGIMPLFSFYKPESHYAALERSRAAAPAPAVLPEPAPAREPATSAGASSPPAPPAYWTDFRGPRRDGRYDEMEILTDWPAQGLTRLWKLPVGGGYASFVVAEGKAFTIEQRRDREVVAAYDIETGTELWTHSWPAHFQESMGGDGPRATPTWHEGRLYALGAEGELRCLHAQTGKLVWSKDILTDNGATNIQWGMAAAPLIVDEKVIVLPGGSPGKSVVAYHKETGEPIWRALDDKQAYSSPMLVTLAGKRQILVVSARRALGLTVENGTLLWEYPWTTQHDINVSQPIVVGESRFLISAGYGHGAALVEVAPTGPRAVWQNTRMKNKFTSSVLHQGHLYGLDEAILACVNVDTGDLKWKGGRYGYGQVVLAGGHLVILTEDGDVALVQATPEGHRELAKFSALDGKTWNHPAIAEGRLLVRNTTEMACFRLGKPLR